MAASFLGAVLIGVALAPPAEASRPFDYATLHKPAQDDQRLRLVVKTVTGIEKPDALTLRASGTHAQAREIKGSVGRWAVNMRSAKGKALISSVKEGFDLGRFAKLSAIGHYGGTCDSQFRVLFKIEGFNQRDDEPQFRKATGCDRAQARTGRGRTGLFGRPYRSKSVMKDGKLRDLVEGTRLKVKFDRDEENDAVIWSSGCNDFADTIVLTDEQVRTDDPPDQTLVECRRRLLRQDEFFANFFKRDPAYVTQGNGLILSTERVTIKLRRKSG